MNRYLVAKYIAQLLRQISSLNEKEIAKKKGWGTNSDFSQELPLNEDIVIMPIWFNTESSLPVLNRYEATLW